MNRDDVPFSMFGHLPKEAEESGQNEIARLRADLAAMTAERDAMRTLLDAVYSRADEEMFEEITSMIDAALDRDTP